MHDSVTMSFLRNSEAKALESPANFEEMCYMHNDICSKFKFSTTLYGVNYRERSKDNQPIQSAKRSSIKKFRRILLKS